MIATMAITIYLLIRQFFLGVTYYDVYVYLNNALIFAGIPVGNISVIYLSPLMPFLTSLIFRLGYISANALFLLDGVIFVLGIAGLYLLLNERFNQIQSITGALIFISFPLIFTWSVSGGIDIPGISISIWTVYLLVLGVRRNSKYLYLVFPLLMVAFLARYTSILLIFPMFLYLIINQNFIKNFKKVTVGVLAGLAFVTPFILFIYNKLGNINPLVNLFTSTLMGAGGAVNDLGYNPDKLYYLIHILNYISVGPFLGLYHQIQHPSHGSPSFISYILVAVVIVGLGIYLYHIFRKIDYHVNKTILHIILLIILLALGVWSFFSLNYLITELVFLAAFYAGFRLIKNTNKNLELDFLFLSWFAAFFIFHSIIPLKVDRYFITMSPAMAYFILLGLSTVIEKYKNRINFRTTTMYLLVGVLLVSVTAATHVGHTPALGYGFQIQSSCNWLEEYDPHYQDKVIFSDYDPAVTWCLKKEVKFGVPNLYPNPDAFSRFLKDHQAYYYIDTLSKSKWDIPGYHVISKMNGIYIYQVDS